MRLGDIASLLRSKNAGPFMLTIDIFFEDMNKFEIAVNSGILKSDIISRLYDVETTEMEYYELPETLSVKISFPRDIPSGSIGDSDVYGCQYMARLAEQIID
jgi:hypothetical protein